MEKPIFLELHPRILLIFAGMLLAVPVVGVRADEPAVPLPQPAYTAEQFVDFIGLAASPFERYLDSGPYAGAGTKYPPETFFDLGVRHYRMGLRDELSKPDAVSSVRRAYARYGARPMMLVDPKKIGSPEKILGVIHEYGGSEVIGEIEGPNEVNNKFPPQELNMRYGGKTDEAAGAAFMRDFLAARTHDADAGKIPVVNFTAIFTDYRLARPCDAFDCNNMHPYQGQRVPSSSLLPNFISANHILPVGSVIKPFVISECGYNVEEDKSNHLGLGGSLHAQALNIPMLFGEYFRHGFIRRTYLFALHNADGYGLLESDQQTRRPAYRTVQSLVAALSDATWDQTTREWKGGQFAPQALPFTVGNAPATFRSITLQKQDGSYILLLWNELPNWDGETHRAIEHPPARVTLQFAVPVRKDAPVWRQGEDGTIRPAESLSTVDSSLTVEVPSTMILVRVQRADTGPARIQMPPNRLHGTATENSVSLSWQPPLDGAPAGGYWVFRNGQCVAATQETTFQDSSAWVRPGLGYTYEVQAYDAAGHMSAREKTIVQTAARFPDLVVTSFGPKEGHPILPGEPVRFVAKLKNAGDGATARGPGTAVTFFIDGEYATYGATGSPIPSGEVRQLISGAGGRNRDGTWTATAGTHILSYLIDDLDNHPEENSKANNIGDQMLIVGEPPGAGRLQASSEGAPWKIDLTQEGAEDWVQWGLHTPDDVNRKQGANLIGALTRIGQGAFLQTGGFAIRTAWSDGTPTKAVEGANASVWTNGVGSGYGFDVPADTVERVLKVYAGGIEGATCSFAASLSDGSAPAYVSRTWTGNRGHGSWAAAPDDFAVVYTVHYQASAPGQHLHVEYKIADEPNRFLGQARLGAATLARVVEKP